MKQPALTIIITLTILCMAPTYTHGIDAPQVEAYTTINFYLKQYNFDKAENLIDKYLKLYPNDPFILTEKAYILKSIKNEKEKAIRFLRTSLTVYPDYYYSNYLYASILFLDYTAEKSMNKDKKADPINMEQAIKHLETSIKDNDQFYESMFMMGMILSDKGEYERSNEFLEKAARLKQTTEPFFYITENYRQLKNTEMEMKAYKRLLELNPYNARALNALSHHHLEKGQVKEAVTYLERLFMKYPNDRRISAEYLYTLFATQDMDKFLEVSDTIDISNSPVLVFARAFFLSRKKRVNDAIDLLNTLKNPDIRARLLLADLYKRRSDYYEAYDILRKIEENDKDYLFYSLNLEVLSLLDMNKRILVVFDKVKTDPDIIREFSLRDYFNVFFACSALENLEALMDTVQLIKSNTEEELKILDELVYMVASYMKGETINPKSVHFDLNIYILVNLYKNQNKFPEAIALLKGVIDRESHQGTYMELGALYLEQKKAKDAEKIIRQMRRKFPDSIEVKNFYAYFLAQQNKELETALKLSEQTLKDQSESPAFLDTYGYILLKMGRTDESGEFLRKAYRKHPFEEEIMEHLADYYRQKNQPEKILEIYQRALENGVDFEEQLVMKIKQTKEMILKTGAPK